MHSGTTLPMPIYEFYCRRCHTIYSFFSNAVAPDARPSCPSCSETTLEKRPSTFATLRHRHEEGDEDPLLDHLDEARLEGAMSSLAQEMEQLGESEDPQQMGRLFRRFGELTGLELGPRMEDALSRLEAGEDLDSVEAEMADDPESESLEDFFQLKKAVQRRRKRPRVDDTLHFF